METAMSGALVGVWIRKGEAGFGGRSAAGWLKESSSIQAGLLWFRRAMGFPESLPRAFTKQLLSKDVVIVTGGRGLGTDSEVKDEK